MPPRRKAKKTRRSRKQAFNLMSAAQTYANTAILTRAAFRTNPIEFFTGQQTITRDKYATVGGVRQVVGQTTSTGYMPILNGTALTLPEIFGKDRADGASIFAGGYSIMGHGGMNAFTDAVRENIRLNGGLVVPVVQTIGVNVGFAVARKLLAKQRRGINKGLKMAGLRKDVMV